MTHNNYSVYSSATLCQIVALTVLLIHPYTMLQVAYAPIYCLPMHVVSYYTAISLTACGKKLADTVTSNFTSRSKYSRIRLLRTVVSAMYFYGCIICLCKLSPLKTLIDAHPTWSYFFKSLKWFT